MGWWGHGIYDGDETQSCHYDFIKWAKIESNEEVISQWLTLKGTKIPTDKLPLLKKNCKLILNKLKLPKHWNEYFSLDWQMLLSLFIDNNVKPPTVVYKNGIAATQYLIDECSDDYNHPAARKKALRAFIAKAQNLMIKQKEPTKQYIYMWFDGDVKRHYFSGKVILNKWLKAFANEVKNNPDSYCDSRIKNKSVKEILKYYSSSKFVEKIELDI